MSTPIGTETPYCSASQFFSFHDRQQIADFLRDGDEPRPTLRAMIDSTSDYGTILISVLLSASGEIEAACLIGNRYTPADLSGLTNSGASYLQKLTAHLSFWVLANRRQPASSNFDSVPGAKLAFEELERLRKGERIFGIKETADAGLPQVTYPSPLLGPQVTLRAARMFGSHAWREQR